MRVLDLFCGLKGWSAAFADRGHDVITLDINAAYNPTIVADVSDITPNQLQHYGFPDIILASPPCECFSVASIGKHWTGGRRSYVPKNKRTEEAIDLVLKSLGLISELKPRYWIMENPRGMLRKILGNPVCTVTYCQYGSTHMKPTDFWGVLPLSFIPRRCHNGDSCHEKAPRGAKTGIQGLKGSALRSLIPYNLSLAMCIAAEQGESLVQKLGG